MSEVITLPLEEIVVDQSLQVRKKLNEFKVTGYAERIRDGWPYPPPSCGRLVDGDGAIYVVDGFHRIAAYKAAGKSEITVHVDEYESFDDMYEAAFRANNAHGLNLTEDETRDGIIKIIKRHPEESLRALADRCLCSKSTIHRYINELSQVGQLKRPEKTIGQDGKERPSTVARPTVPTDGPEYTLCPQCGTPIWPENMGNPDYTYTEQGGRWFCCPDCADEWESSQKSAAATDLTGIPETLPQIPSAALPTRPNPSLEPEHPAHPVDPDPEETDPFAPAPEQTEDEKKEAAAEDCFLIIKNFRPQSKKEILILLINKLNMNKFFLAQTSKITELPEEEKTDFVWPLIDGTEWTAPRSMVERWKKSYPAVDVEQQLRNCIEWNYSNPRRRKTRKGIEDHIRTWLQDKQDNPWKCGGGTNQNAPRHNGRKSGYVSRDAGLDFEHLEY